MAIFRIEYLLAQSPSQTNFSNGFVTSREVAISETMAEMQATVDIPEPKGLPFIGNITSIDPEFPLGSMKSLADQFGEPKRGGFMSTEADLDVN